MPDPSQTAGVGIESIAVVLQKMRKGGGLESPAGQEFDMELDHEGADLA
jgi:hypothetical protein